MEPLSLALIAAGILALVIGVSRIRGPVATIRRLEETEANLRRYEVWRGRDTSVRADGPTGADEMRALMRRSALLWGGLIVAGIVAIVAGLLLD